MTKRLVRRCPVCWDFMEAGQIKWCRACSPAQDRKHQSLMRKKRRKVKAFREHDNEIVREWYRRNKAEVLAKKKLYYKQKKLELIKLYAQAASSNLNSLNRTRLPEQRTLVCAP